MTAMKNIPSLIGRAAVLAATTVGLTAGLAPASAAPNQTPGANLYIFPDPANSANYRVTIKGMFPMSEYDAHGYINNLGTGERPDGVKIVGGIEYNLLGDDPDNNDRGLSQHWFPLAGSDTEGYLKAESDGIHYLREISLPKSALNEDDGVFDDTDEVYAYVRFVDGDGGVRRAYTNPVSGTF